MLNCWRHAKIIQSLKHTDVDLINEWKKEISHCKICDIHRRIGKNETL